MGSSYVRYPQTRLSALHLRDEEACEGLLYLPCFGTFECSTGGDRVLPDNQYLILFIGTIGNLPSVNVPLYDWT